MQVPPPELDEELEFDEELELLDEELELLEDDELELELELEELEDEELELLPPLATQPAIVACEFSPLA